jgi:ribose 5-phosphate isomerase A
MTEIDPAKARAAEAAAAVVESGMAVGLGSGTTASLAIRTLGERVRREGLRIIGVPTSEATAALAREVQIPLKDLDEVDVLDLDIDGADEVDPALRMIKGRGAALLREKIVAAASRRRVIAVSPGKRVERLGRVPVPLEVCSFGLRHTETALRALGASTALRLRADGSPLVTDGGNRIIDCRFGAIDDPAALDARLKSVVGVFETGLFVGLCDLLILGHADRVETIERAPHESL